MLKKYFANFFFNTNVHVEITSIVMEIITLKRLYNFVHMMQSMNGVVW